MLNDGFTTLAHGTLQFIKDTFHLAFAIIQQLTANMSTSLELMLDETKAMNVVFKENYKVFAFAKLTCLEPEWELQVQHIRQLWNAIGNLIDRDEFYSMLSSECTELALLYEDYHMETAFKNANKKLAMELMVLVAESILKWFDDDIPLDATIVPQESETILIDISVCRLYRHQLLRIV